MGAVLYGEHACRSTKTATHVEHTHAGPHLRLAGQSTCCLFATAVKLVQRRQRLRVAVRRSRPAATTASSSVPRAAAGSNRYSYRCGYQGDHYRLLHTKSDALAYSC